MSINDNIQVSLVYFTSVQSNKIIFRLEPDEILKINEKTTQMKCGNFSLVDDGLKLGDLNGNRFSIALRQVEGDDLIIENCINSLKHNGFINYYGLQRFGTTEVATHEIGKCLLKNNFKDAIDLILKPRKTCKNGF
jgi:tRNA pseudouridine13 synthase